MLTIISYIVSLTTIFILTLVIYLGLLKVKLIYKTLFEKSVEYNSITWII